MKTPSSIVLLTALLLHTASAQAQQIWRCGAEGRSFSDQPCANGEALEPTRPRPTADVAAAAERQSRDAALAETLRQERLQREAEPAATESQRAGKARRVSTSAAARERPVARQHKLKRAAADGTFRATVPASPRSSG